jgi:hypothetical protein
MPTKVGIHGFSERITIKAWMPTPAFAWGRLFVGMTMRGRLLCLNPQF